MTREEALQIVTSLIKNKNLVKHHLAAEAAMRGIAETLKQRKDPNINPDDWALVGLLHDADYELTHDAPEKHTLILEEKIGSQVSPEIMYAIKSHNGPAIGVQPQSLMDWAMYTCDELTGFIIACALIRPEKKLEAVDVNFVLNRMKEPGFARAVDRNQIKLCEDKLNISLVEYIEIVLNSMKGISGELGL